LYYPVVEDVDGRDKRGHDDPRKSGLAVQRVSAAPREATSPGFFKFLFARDDYCSSVIFSNKIVL